MAPPSGSLNTSQAFIDHINACTAIDWPCPKVIQPVASPSIDSRPSAEDILKSEEGYRRLHPKRGTINDYKSIWRTKAAKKNKQPLLDDDSAEEDAVARLLLCVEEDGIGIGTHAAPPKPRHVIEPTATNIEIMQRMWKSATLLGPCELKSHMYCPRQGEVDPAQERVKEYIEDWFTNVMEVDP